MAGHLALLALVADENSNASLVHERGPVLLTLATSYGGISTAARPDDKLIDPPSPPSAATATAPPTSPSPASQAPPPSPPTSTTSDSGVASTEGCAMVERLQDRLERDQDALSALRKIPLEARSVANAVQLWDGAWITLKTGDGQDLQPPIQRAIIGVVRSATPACRAEQVTGPRLVLVEQGEDTLALSLGSGAWRWSDLLAPGDSPLA